MNDMITHFYDTQGKCERIKKTPFPRPFAYLGQIFTAIFIILLPLGFLDIFADESVRYVRNAILEREYMFAMIPFTMLLSWVFYMMEKVSDSMEDPFERGVNDLLFTDFTPPKTPIFRRYPARLRDFFGEIYFMM